MQLAPGEIEFIQAHTDSAGLDPGSAGGRELENWWSSQNLRYRRTRQGDVNGHIEGGHSKNGVLTPMEFLIKTPEGVAITEYQLIRLHDDKDSREFRTVTGGVLHVSGGATRDIIPFEGKKAANRTYSITLPNLGIGEYGFLPPAQSRLAHLHL